MSEPADEPAAPAPRQAPRAAIWLSAVVVVVALGIAATPFWAPAVTRLLPWGAPAHPRTPDPALAALEALRGDTAKTAVVVQQLGQRVAGLEAKPALAAPDLAPVQQQLQQLGQKIAGLEAKPAPAAPDLAPLQQQLQQLLQRIAGLEAKPAPPDLAPLQQQLQQLLQRIAGLEAKPAPAAPDLAPVQQQLATLSKSVAELAATVARLEKAAPAQPAADAANTALALVLLQIREAVDVARPFEAEYKALLALARNHPDIAAAAAALERPAASGVASRAVLAERLRQLAPQIAAAQAPANPSWWGQIAGELRSLVTIRRLDGAAQTPAEAAVSGAERAVAGGDLAGAIAALDALTGANKDAAAPWLGMARSRLLVETTLRRIEAMVTAQMGGAAAATGAPG